jgi:hypothetical protein
MSYPKQLVRLTPNGGFNFDTVASEVGGHWTTGENVLVRNGFASRIAGRRIAYGSLSANPLKSVNVQSGGVNYWVYVSEDAQHVVAGSTHSNVTLLGGLTTQAAAHKHSLSLLNGVVIHNNAANPPMFWPGSPSDEFEALPGWPTGAVAQKIIAHRFHLFALGMEDGSGAFPMKFLWSHAAEPGAVPSTWSPAADNEAGDSQLSDTRGPVLDGVKLRESLLLYKPTSVYLVDYIAGRAGSEIFSVRPLFSTFGALNSQSQVDIGGRHFVVSQNDVILHDGSQYESIAHRIVRRFLFNNLNQDALDSLFVVANPRHNEVWVCFPETNSPIANKALAWNWQSGAWSAPFDIPLAHHGALGIINDDAPSKIWDDQNYTWDSAAFTWNQQGFRLIEDSLLLTGEDALHLMDSEDALSVSASFGKHQMHFGESDRVKFIRQIHVRAPVGFGTLNVRLGSQMSISDPVTWSPTITLTEPEQIAKVSVQGRFISLEISSNGVARWTIPGVDMEIELRGYF